MDLSVRPKDEQPTIPRHLETVEEQLHCLCFRRGQAEAPNTFLAFLHNYGLAEKIDPYRKEPAIEFKFGTRCTVAIIRFHESTVQTRSGDQGDPCQVEMLGILTSTKDQAHEDECRNSNGAKWHDGSHLLSQ
jgi:hypothetical protein